MESSKRNLLASAAIALGALSAPDLEAQELIPTKPSDQRATLENPLAGWDSEYTNWVEISVGDVFVNGSHAEFQRRYQVPAAPFGGVESFHVQQALSTNTMLTIEGRGIFDNHDYDLRLDLTKDKVGFIRAGYREFRTWYDREGGYFPPDRLWLTPFDREVAIDRGDAWIELGLRLPDVPEITFRYDHEFRQGDKDSTSWGEVTTSAGPRKIIPSFYGIDETRDSFQSEVKHTISGTELEGGLRSRSATSLSTAATRNSSGDTRCRRHRLAASRVFMSSKH